MSEKTARKRLRKYRRIACATRGGEASRATEDAAIDLAHKHGAELIFLYVVDVTFAHGHSGKFPIEVVESGVREIGEVVLEQARRRAKENGVKARGEIRTGRVAEEIERFIESSRKLDALVVGHMSEELRTHLEEVLKQVEERQIDVIVVGNSEPTEFPSFSKATR